MGFEARDRYRNFIDWQKNWQSGEPCPVCGAVAYRSSIGNSVSLYHNQVHCGQRWKYEATLEANEAAKNVIRNHRIWIR
jgi:hypothetical protein